MPKMSPPDVAAVSGLIDTYLRSKEFLKPPRGFKKFHPSAWGKCLRNMQYLRYSEDEDSGLTLPTPEQDSSKILLFANGHFIQDKWTQYWIDLNMLRGIWQCTNPLCKMWDDNGNVSFSEENSKKILSQKLDSRKYGLDISYGCYKPEKCICGNKEFDYHETPVKSEELNFHGHADLILDFRNINKEVLKKASPSFDMNQLPKGVVVADMKTASNESFKKVLEYGPPIYYQVQLQIYANILDCDSGLLIYENKDNSKIALFKIERGKETVWPIIVRQSKQMQAMYEYKDETGKRLRLLPPPRPLDKDDFECRKCHYKEMCHSSPIWNDPKLNEKRKKFYDVLL